MNKLQQGIEFFISERLAELIESLKLSDYLKKRIFDQNEILSKRPLKSRGKKHKPRDPDAPKQPKNAYMLFADDCRSFLKTNETKFLPSKGSIVDELSKVKNNEMKPTEVASFIGNLWKSVKEDEKLYNKYYNSYKKQHQEYVQLKKKYQDSKGSTINPEDSSTTVNENENVDDEVVEDLESVRLGAKE